MDTTTFIVELIKALAWPAVIVGLILFLRKPLRDLIPLLIRLKYKDFEIEFGKKIEEAKAEAAVELSKEAAVKALPPQPDEKLAKLAEVSPRAAVLEAWRQTEHELVRAAAEVLRKQMPCPT